MINNFKQAQNRVALLLLGVVFMQFASSYELLVFEKYKLRFSAEGMIMAELINNIFIYIIMFAVPCIIYFIVSKKNIFKFAYKFSVHEKPFETVFFSIAILFSTSYLYYFITKLFPTVSNAQVQTTEILSSPSYTVLYLVKLAILPAFFEELIFRGIILSELLPHGRGIAMAFSGILFGISHMQEKQIFFATVAGFVFAYFVIESGSLWISMIIHMLNNLFCGVLELLTHDSPIYTTVDNTVTLSMLFLGFVSAILLLKRKRKILDIDDSLENKIDIREHERTEIKSLFKSISPLMYSFIGLALGITFVYTIYNSF